MGKAGACLFTLNVELPTTADWDATRAQGLTNNSS